MRRYFLWAALVGAAVCVAAPCVINQTRAADDDELSKLQAELAALDRQESALETEGSNLKTEKANLDRQAQSLKNKATQLQNQKDQADKDGTNYNNKKSALSQAINKLKSQKAGLDRDKNALTKTKSELSSEYSSIKSAERSLNTRSQAAVNAFNARVDAYRKKQAKFNSDVGSYNMRLQNIQNEQKSLSNKFKELENLRNALNAKLRALDSGYKDHRTGVSNYTTRANAYNQRIKNFSQKYQAIQTKKAQVKAKMQQAKARPKASSKAPGKKGPGITYDDNAPKGGLKKGGTSYKTTPGKGKDPHPETKMKIRLPDGKGGSAGSGGKGGTTGGSAGSSGKGGSGSVGSGSGQGTSGKQRPSAGSTGGGSGSQGGGSAGGSKAGAGRSPGGRPIDYGYKPRLGSLSRRYEVGPKGGPGTISTGKGDPKGGVSYGDYQLSTKQGTAQKFADKYYPDEFKGLKAGSKEFNDAWKKLADKDPKEFSKKQHDYIQDTHYDPMVKALKKNLNLDVENRSDALKDVVWSASVQHGPTRGANLFKNALDGKDASKLTDKDIIEKVYDERGKVDPKDEDKLKYFPKDAGMDGLLKRIKKERKDALKALEKEQPATKDIR